MIAKSIVVLLVLGAVAADLRHNDRPFAGVNPNTLSCDPLGQVELLLPHHKDCTRFYQCVHGREVERLCARPLIFDFEIQNCNWERETTCILRNEDDGEETPTSDEKSGENEGDQGGGNGGSGKPMEGVDPNTLSCDPEGQIFLLLPHHSDCTRYYQCANGREVLMPACPHPLIFDFELQGCNWEWDATCILRTPEGEQKSEENKKSSEEEDKSKSDNSDSNEENESESKESGDENASKGSDSDQNVSESQESSKDVSEKSKEDSDEQEGENSGDSDDNEEGGDITSEEKNSGQDSGSISEGSGDSDENEGEADASIEGSGSGDGSGDFDWLAYDLSEPNVNPLDILAKLTGVVKAVRLESKQESEFSAILDCTRADSASRHVAHRADCQRFWRCIAGIPQTFYCSDGLFFNDHSQQCDFESNVRCLAGQIDELDGEFIVYK